MRFSSCPQVKNLAPLALLLILIVPVAYAQSIEPQVELDWFKMAMWLMGGLALFLYGMERMIEGLLAVSGEKLKTILGKLTTNRLAGAATGTLVTATIQSSSVTTVLVVGFISAGLLTLTQGISVIMGANLGTTITAQIIAFKVTNLAMLMIAVGFFIQFLAKTKRTYHFGTLILGFGLLFFGMDVMSIGMAPLRDYPPFIELMRQMEHPLFGILVGFVFTALVQSSSATIGVVIVLASNGFLTLPAGIALVLGADIGTCVTALLAAIGKTRDALRAALSHVFFNVFGVLIWLPFLPFLADIALWLTLGEVQAAVHTTVHTLPQDTAREIANANTFFKLSVLLLFLPLLGFLVWAVYKIVPISQEELSQAQNKPKFLDPVQLHTPSLALEAIYKEIERVGTMTVLYYRHANQAVLNGDVDSLAKLELEGKRLYELHTEILAYVGNLASQPISDAEKNKLLRIIAGLDVYENMLDVVKQGLLDAGNQMIDHKIKPSATMQALFENLSKEIEVILSKSFEAAYVSDSRIYPQMLESKVRVDTLIAQALEHQARALNQTEKRILTFRLEMQLADAFKRLHTLAKRASRIAEGKMLEQADSAPSNLVS